MKNGILMGVIALAAASAANAGMVTYNGGLPVQNGATWTQISSLPQWNPALFPGQTLTGVTLTVYGTVTGLAKGENEDGAPATISLDLSAILNISAPAGLVVQALPLVNNTFNASAYDGTTDFGGTSGVSYTGLSNTATNSTSLFDPPTNLSAYIGAGSINATIQSFSTSTGSGAGNLSTQFQARTGALLEITYYYIPTPGSMALLGLGGLAAARRRR